MLSKDTEEGCLVQDAGGDATDHNKPEQSTNDKFFRYFQEEVTKVEARITKLHTTPTAGGEQASAADYCLADISRLSDEVKDASTYIPSYDQRAYASAIKALQEKFADAKEAIAPRKRFAFKRSRQPTPVLNTTDEVMQDTPETPQTTAPNPSPEPTTRVALVSHEKVTDNMEPEPLTAVDEGKKETQQEEQAVKEQEKQQQEEKEQLQPQRSESQLPAAQVISFSDIENSHATLPSSAPLRNASLSVSSVQKSVIDMSSIPELGRSFSTCIFRDSCDSLAIFGKVDGPAFISDVIDSVVVVTCHQFRMHDCNNVVVYLSCATNPIIEGCVDIKFSPLPEAFSAQNGKQADKWSLVEDFNWLKPGPSPNWSVLEDEDTVEDHVWGRLLGDKRGMKLTEILEKTGVTGLAN
ncbi:tubulin-specific chaperone c, putative [Trichophyton benhamiae CBS 112371]|uniref:Tubulin-specific chaperone c, putative n=1 Tax=Arthroderma benhamiae (strain ATCC MYA-4681 / CBS 112371) TaxID=663331 RepID=D4AJR4_ARTBC|nr:tubulin-specific chaperone c, putative [Trichophyton benhamiae CBS 112371]EFE36987.1 tubulin-specific chaperone c, putative [Trichophyton benhamiae CBS 112371]